MNCSSLPLSARAFIHHAAQLLFLTHHQHCPQPEQTMMGLFTDWEDETIARIAAEKMQQGKQLALEGEDYRRDILAVLFHLKQELLEMEAAFLDPYGDALPWDEGMPMSDTDQMRLRRAGEWIGALAEGNGAERHRIRAGGIG